MDETKSQVALPPDIENGQRVAAALAGDADAMSTLYGIAAMLIRKGRAIPEPLAAAIADRLDAISNVMRTTPEGKDLRSALPAAVAPGGHRGRPKTKMTPDRLRRLQLGIATEYEQGSLKERAAKVSEQSRESGRWVTGEAIEDAVKELGRMGLGAGMAGGKIVEINVLDGRILSLNNCGKSTRTLLGKGKRSCTSLLRRCRSSARITTSAARTCMPSGSPGRVRA